MTREFMPMGMFPGFRPKERDPRGMPLMPLVRSILVRLESEWLVAPASPDAVEGPPCRPECCERCGLTVSVGESRTPCSACRGRTAAADRIVRLGELSGRLRRLVLDCKYRRDVLAAEELGVRIAARTREVGWEWRPNDAVSAVPMPLSRRFRRGIDHAGEIARIVASELGIPLVRPLRHQGGRPRARQDRAGRAAARIAPRWGFGEGDLDGLRLLLVDDVLTTGSTLGECAKALRRLGAGEVWGLVAAVVSDPLRGDTRSNPEKSLQHA